MKLLRLSALFMLALLFFAIADAIPTTLLCDDYTTKILSQVADEKYLEAMNSAADYDLAMYSQYPPASYENGEFHSAAHHMSFQNPMAGFEALETNNEGILSDIKGSGINILLALKNADTDDRLILMAFDLGAYYRQIGLEEGRITDKRMSDNLSSFVGNNGRITTQSFVNIRKQRVLCAEVIQDAEKPSSIIMAIANSNQLFYFYFLPTGGDTKENTKKLLQLIETLSFSYLPSDTETITRIRKANPPKCISDRLRTIRELASAAEFGAACEDISTLRNKLAEKLPHPQIVSNTAIHSIYGISLKNPDQKKWRLEVTTKELDSISFKDQFAVEDTGFIIITINLNLAFGPALAKMLSKADTTDDTFRNILKGSGRGGLKVNSNGDIFNEHFRTFKGAFAYEGTVDVAVTKDAREKTIVFIKNGALIAVLITAPKKKFDEKAALFETILDKYLTIK